MLWLQSISVSFEYFRRSCVHSATFINFHCICTQGSRLKWHNNKTYPTGNNNKLTSNRNTSPLRTVRSFFIRTISLFPVYSTRIPFKSTFYFLCLFFTLLWCKELTLWQVSLRCPDVSFPTSNIWQKWLIMSCIKNHYFLDYLDPK